MTTPTVALILSVILIGSCLQGAVGFGLGMLGSPIIGIIAPELLPGVIIFPALVLTAAIVVVERENINLKGAGYALAGRVPGAVLGALLVLWLPTKGLVMMVAATVFIGSLVAISGWAPSPTPRNVVLAGCASGLMGTATAIGGPPMALVWTGEERPAAYRATMAAYFLIGTGISCALLLVTGAVDSSVLIWTVWAAPAVIAGVALSRLIAPRLNRQATRTAAIVVSLGSSVIAALNAVLPQAGWP